MHGALLLVAIFGLVALPVICAWIVLGVGASRLLRSDRSIVAFNRCLAALLVASPIPIVFRRQEHRDRDRLDFLDTLKLSPEASLMPRRRPSCSPEFRCRMVIGSVPRGADGRGSNSPEARQQTGSRSQLASAVYSWSAMPDVTMPCRAVRPGAGDPIRTRIVRIPTFIVTIQFIWEWTHAPLDPALSLHPKATRET